MDLHISSLGILVPEGPWCVFYATRRQLYWGLIHNVVFRSALISHTYANTQGHTSHSWASTLTHPYKYIFTPPLCAHISYLYYIEWIIHWYQKFTFYMSFLFKKYSLVKVIYLLIRFYKTSFFLWNTNNTDRNGVNKQNTYTLLHTKHSEKDNAGIG